MSTAKLFYVAGPFRAKKPGSHWEVAENVRRAERVGFKVAQAGGFPVIPHANTANFEGELDDMFWLDGTLEMLRRCDAVVMAPGWIRSTGAKRERAEALSMGLPVFHDFAFTSSRAAAALKCFVADVLAERPYLHASEGKEPGKLVALTGAAGCGKSSIAQELVDSNGFVRLRFAGTLKAMLRTMGLSAAQIDGDEKQAPCELLGGRTSRDAMQTLGTEWGRDCIDPDLWARCVLARAKPLLRQGISVVIDDCRFDNEARVARAVGGDVVLVLREDNTAALQGVAAQHASEAGVSPELVNATLKNDRSIAWAAGELLHAIQES